MEYEYDPAKSRSNKIKHGIDFEEAKGIWINDNIILPAIARGERRYMIIGEIGDQYYSCIFTIRDDSVRIISCRKSRGKEKSLYDKEIKE